MNISQKIIDYAIWYYLRYFPSRQKLSCKIIQKFWPDSEKWKIYGWISNKEVDYILNEKMRNIIQERNVCSAKIKNLIAKNKKISYIKNNLRQKQFDPNMIEDILRDDFLYHERSILDEEKLIKKIRILKSKNKSMFFIKQTLGESDFDIELIENILEKHFPDGDALWLANEYEKIQWKYTQNKIIEKLLRKWFHYGDIKQHIDGTV